VDGAAGRATTGCASIDTAPRARVSSAPSSAESRSGASTSRFGTSIDVGA
jgi:hypothetical protein